MTHIAISPWQTKNTSDYVASSPVVNITFLLEECGEWWACSPSSRLTQEAKKFASETGVKWFENVDYLVRSALPAFE